jgi:hypothetical protein
MCLQSTSANRIDPTLATFDWWPKGDVPAPRSLAPGQEPTGPFRKLAREG